ncbi:hypothetical protein [Achromobacter denitrificans]|uniref:hypothetical protein n=1 Tax=Achromobacter denitrificans TaxID=32002 RepID=UPI000B48BE20|nr:hypothetical protein [Achromobacter denitrificans]
MITQNNAAQAADTTPFSDEYVNAVIQQHGYDSPECVIARLHQWIGLHGGENGLTLLMYEAHKALVKLRAPVADERAQHDNWYSRTHMHEYSRDATWRGWQERARRDTLASAPVAEPAAVVRDNPEDYGTIIDPLAVLPVGTLLYAGAPVAGEAPPTDWQNALRIAELPEVDEALAVFCNDGTLDNAVGLVQAILDAAPQVSDGVLPAPCHDLRYHDQYRIGWNRCLDACRAALAAQPAKKPATSAPSPAASQRQAMVPGSQESDNSHTDGGAVYA